MLKLIEEVSRFHHFMSRTLSSPPPRASLSPSLLTESGFSPASSYPSSSSSSSSTLALSSFSQFILFPFLPKILSKFPHAAKVIFFYLYSHHSNTKVYLVCEPDANKQPVLTVEGDTAEQHIYVSRPAVEVCHGLDHARNSE